MKYLKKCFAIIGLMSISHVAVAIDNVVTGDILTAAGVNEIIDATNANTDALLLGFDVTCAVYSVGDPGPENGLVFYVTADGCHGLEAWTADEADDDWGCTMTQVGAFGTGIGTGGPNTLAIDNAICLPGAAGSTRAAIHGTTPETDWYLPSKDELSLMYATIGPGGANIGVWTLQRYWSSTEDDIDQAWVVDFGDVGREKKDDKSNSRNVRAIRTF